MWQPVASPGRMQSVYLKGNLYRSTQRAYRKRYALFVCGGNYTYTYTRK